MVDKINPTNQFHPYTPTDAIPQSERSQGGGLSRVLERVGISRGMVDSVTGKIRSVDVKQSAGKARDFARNNSALTLGSLAVAAIGAGLLMKRRRAL